MRDAEAPDPLAHSDRSIYDIYIANRASAALAVAVRLDLFEILAKEPCTLRQLCDETGFERRPLDALLTALVSMGLLRREGTGVDGPLSSDDGPRYVPTRTVREHLLADAPFFLGGLIDLENEHFVTPTSLIEAMRRNRPVAYEGTDPWEAMRNDPEAAAEFTRAMHSISIRPAFGLAAVFDFSSVNRLLDVGGGSGILAIAAVLRYPGLRATVLELPAIAEVSRETVSEYQVSDRVSIVTGDMFAEPFPAGHDAVLFSQILHDWPVEKARLLLGKAYGALPPDGWIVIHEKLLTDQRDGPLANALVSVDMLFWTEGQQYSPRELHHLLEEAGFEQAQTAPTVGYWSVTWGRKPHGDSTSQIPRNPV